MKITVFKSKGQRESIVREPLDAVVKAMVEGAYIEEVHYLRQLYPLIHPSRDEEGRMVSNFNFKMTLPRLCFPLEMQKLKDERKMLAYNGLVVLEANNLADYDEAIRLRNAASRLPQTLLTFLGASGRSVKMVCRGELFPDSQRRWPEGEEEAARFHQALFATARKAYNAQLDITLEAYEPRLSRIVYISADPDLKYRPQAVPFYVDPDEEAQEPAVVAYAPQDNLLMPGRTQTRTYQLNYHFILTDVMGEYFELPDEGRVAKLLMDIAARCLKEDIPQATAESLTLSHPVLNADRMLVEKTFENVYAVKQQADYMKRRKLKPLHSVPDDTLMTMKTNIYLNTHYEMRKNIMTGVAQYREKNGYGQEFQDLDQEARNEMTMRAKELGLKSWDKDIDRFIDSPRIEKYDPVNDWLDHLPRWDGEDRVADLAARVPTSQPQWQHYLHTWLLGMVAHWHGRKSLTGNAIVPLLIGRQGCGKTSFCRILLPRELRDYYNDRINFKNDTDLNLGLTAFALINIDEFDKTTARQQVLLKYLLSTADVKFRPPYGKAIKQYRRYASFIGTTNHLKPLTDPTGSRRFVCAEITGLIDFDDTLDHRQLYAQLKQEVADGMRYWLDDEEIKQLIDENKPFLRLPSLAEMVCLLFRVPEGDEGTWYGADEVLDMLKRRFGEAALAGCSDLKLGKVLGTAQLNFPSTHKNDGNYHRMVLR